MNKFLAILALTFIFSLGLGSTSAFSAQVHRVESGESLYTIAQHHGVTVNELVSVNGYLRDINNISVKQVLIIPQANAQVIPDNIYTVVPGDILYKIAQKLRVSVDAISSQNNISNKDFLYVGQVLVIPSKTLIVPAKDSLIQIEPKTQIASQYSVAQLAKMYSDTFYLKGSAGGGKIALTFDDGPDAKYTEQVLDVLQEYNTPSTFFLLGKNALEFSSVVERIDREGHIIGNHSRSHPNLAKVGIERLHSEIMETERILKKITGKNTALIRPPYGAVSKEAIEYMRDLNYKVVNWSVDSVDWRDRDVDQILINTLPSVRGGGILLFHTAGGEGQSFAATVAALSEMIYTLKVQGYEFVTIDELLSILAYK